MTIISPLRIQQKAELFKTLATAHTYLSHTSDPHLLLINSYLVIKIILSELTVHLIFFIYIV